MNIKYFVFLVAFRVLSAAVPADISLLVADVKYSQEGGAQICEIQPWLLSTFYGYNEHNGDIGKDLTTFLCRYHDTFYVVTSKEIFPPMLDSFKKLGWHFIKKEKELPNLGPIIGDGTAISDYRALVFGGKNTPGFLAIDAANASFWMDKYKMSLFLNGEKVKPRWGLFPKKYSKDLVQKIHQNINSDVYVIKPRGSTRGNGVLIVSKEELDQTLKLILEETSTLEKNEDRSYRYWYEDSYKFRTFIVEEFVPSDPVVLEGKSYNGTIRMVFALVHDQGNVDLHYFGGYWFFPVKSLEEVGSLTEKNKAEAIAFVSAELDSSAWIRVQEELREPLLRFYKRMLKLQ